MNLLAIERRGIVKNPLVTIVVVGPDFFCGESGTRPAV